MNERIFNEKSLRPLKNMNHMDIKKALVNM